MKKQLIFTTMLLITSLLSFGQSLKLDAIGTNDMRLRTSNLDRLNILNNGNVGIGTATPTAKLDINGEIKVEGTYMNALGGGTITFDPLNRQSKSLVYLYMSVGTNAIIKGFSAPNPSNPIDGTGTLLFLNIGGTSTVTIEHNTANFSTNAIWTNTGGTITFTNSGSATFIYNDYRWWLLSYAQ